MLVNVNEKQHGVRVLKYGIEYIITNTAKISNNQHKGIQDRGHLKIKKK